MVHLKKMGDPTMASDYPFLVSSKFSRGRCGRDRMVVEFTTSSAISVYRYYSWELKYCSGEVYSIQHHRDKVCQ